jgi:NADH dehydrogenase (ubiquinone) Fe-S protein 1
MIITGSSVFERKDANELTNLLYSICENSPILNKEKHWNGFNVLHQEAAKAGALDLGIPTSFNQDIKPKFVYLLGADKFKKQDLPEDSFIVYQVRRLLVS